MTFVRSVNKNKMEVIVYDWKNMEQVGRLLNNDQRNEGNTN